MMMCDTLLLTADQEPPKDMLCLVAWLKMEAGLDDEGDASVTWIGRVK